VREGKMRQEEGILKKFFSTTVPGKAYYFHYHPDSHYDAYVETADGFELVEVKQAAIDCGVPDLRQSGVPDLLQRDPSSIAHYYGDVLFSALPRPTRRRA